MANYQDIEKVWQEFQKNPDNQEAFVKLQDYFLYAKDWQRLVQALLLHAQAIEKAAPDKAAALYFQAGKQQQQNLQQAQAALHSYQQAHRLLPQQEEYLQAWVKLAVSLNQWELAIEGWHKQLEMAKDNSSQLAILYQIAMVWQKEMGKTQQAKKYLQQILERSPSHQKAFASLELLLLEEESYQELVELYQKQLATLADKERKLKRLKQITHIYEHHFSSQEQALPFYQEILALSHNQDEYALSGLEKIYQQREDWAALAEILEIKVSQASGKKQVAELKKLAEIYLNKLQQQEQGWQAYEKILDLHGEKEIFQTLEVIYKQKQQWQRLAQLWEKKLQDHTLDDLKQKKSLCFSLGELYYQKLQDGEKAATFLEQSLDKQNPEQETLSLLEEIYSQFAEKDKLISLYKREISWWQEEALQWRAYSKLASLYQQQQHWQEASKIYQQMLQKFPHQQESYQQLKKIYHQQDNKAALLEVLLQEAKVFPQHRSVELLQQIVSLMQQLDRLEEAEAYCLAILEKTPKNWDVWQLLLEIYQKSERWQKLVQSYQRLGHLFPERKKHALWQAGEIEEKLGRFPEAIQIYQNLTQDFPDYLPVWKKLEHLYQQQQQSAERMKVVEKISQLVVEKQEKICYLRKMYDFYQEQQDVAQQEKILRSILQADSFSSFALRELKQLYQQQQQWARVIPIYQKESQLLSPSSQELVAHYQAIASLYLQLEKFTQAANYYEKVLVLQPGETEALKNLEVIYTREEKFSLLASVLEKRAQVTEKLSEKCNYLYMAGILWEEKIRDEKRAIVLYESILSKDPLHLNALEKLRKIYRSKLQKEKLEEVYQALEQYYANSKTKRIELYLEAAQSLGKNKLEYYKKVLVLDPQHPLAEKEVLKIYQQTENFYELLPIYQKALQKSDNQQERVATLMKMADIYWEKLQQPEKALWYYQQVMKTVPDHAQAIKKAEKICRDNNYLALITILKNRVQFAIDSQHKKTYLKSLAEVSLERGKLTEAKEAYQQLLKMGSDERTLQKLIWITEKQANYSYMVELLEQQLALTKDPKEQRELLQKKAASEEQLLGSRQAAIATWQRLLKQFSQDEEALEELRRLFRLTGQRQQEIPVLDRQIALKRKQQQQVLPLLLQKAQLLLDIGTHDQAAELLRRILASDPQETQARQMLSQLYMREEKWQELIELHERELQNTKDYKRICTLYFELGQIWLEKLSRPEEALEMYLQALELDHENLAAVRNVQLIYQRKGDYQQLIQAYEQELTLTEEKQRKIWLWLQIAELQELQLHNREAAKAAYLKVLQNHLDPGNILALQGVQRSLRQEQAHQELQLMLLKELEIQEDQKRIEQLQKEIAKLKEELGDAEGALEYYQLLHERFPDNRFFLDRLRALHEELENWQEYVETTQEEIALVSEEAQVSLHQKAMQVYNEKLDKPEQAINHGEQTLAIFEQHLPTICYLQKLYWQQQRPADFAKMCLREIALTTVSEQTIERVSYLYLEAGKVYSQDQSNWPQAIECLQTVLHWQPDHSKAREILIKLYQKTQSWKELSQVYEQAAMLANTPEEEEKWWLKNAWLWENKLHMPKKAAEYFYQALRQNPQNGQTITQLRLVEEKLGNWGQAIELLKKEVALCEESKTRAILNKKIGEIWQEQLHAPALAVKHYYRVLEYGFHRETASRIIQIEKSLHNYRALAKILEEDIRHSEASEIHDKLLQLGKVYQQASQREEAKKVYGKVLKNSPQDPEALEQIAKIFADQQDWQQLRAILLRKLKNTQDPEQLFALYWKIGTISERELQHLGKAISAYEKALELFPEDIKTIHVLLPLYQSMGFFQEWVELAEREIGLSQDKSRKVALYLKVGQMARDKLFEQIRATTAYEKALELDPQLPEALQALSELYCEQQLYDKWFALQQKLLQRAQQQEDSPQQIEILTAMAKIYYYELQEAQKAANHLQQVLQIDPVNEEAFLLLENIFRQQHKYQELAELVSKRLTYSSDQQERLEWLIYLGQIWMDKIQNYPKAIEYFLEADQLAPQNWEIVKALEFLYQQTDKIYPLLEVLKRKVELAPSSQEQAESCYQVGKMYLHQFEKPEQAKSYFQQALASCFHHQAGLALVEIFWQEQNWPKVAELLEQIIPKLEKEEEKITQYLRLGEVYRQHLQDNAQARIAYYATLALHPGEKQALQVLADIAFEEQDWQETELLLARLLPHTKEEFTPQQAAWYYYCWGKAAWEMEKVSEAGHRFLEAIALQKDFFDPHWELANLYFAQQQWQEAVRFYQLARQLANPEQKEKILWQIAKAYEALEEIHQAIESYEALLGLTQDYFALIKALVKQYAQVENYAKCQEYLEELLEKESDRQIQHWTLKNLADAYRKQQKIQQAKEAYLRAEEMQGDSWVKKQLVFLYIEEENWPEALRWQEKRSEQLEKPEEILEGHLVKARILSHLPSQQEQAIAEFHKAWRLDPQNLKAIRGIAKICTIQEKWQELAGYYQQFLAKLPAEKETKAVPIHLQLGYLYHEQLEDDQQAMEHFAQVLEIEPEHQAAQIALAELQSQFPNKRKEAISSHLKVLRRNPFRVESYFELFHLLKDAGKLDHASRAYRALQVLAPEATQKEEFLSPDELTQSILSSSQVRKLTGFRKSDAFWALLPKHIQPMAEILSLTADCLDKIFPPTLEEKYGLTKKDHLGAQEVQQPVWYYTYKLMEILGISDLHLYLHEQNNHQIFLENTPVPSVLLSRETVASFSEEELKFLLSKYLFFVAQRQHSAALLAPQELKEYLKGLRACVVEQDFVDANSRPAQMQRKIRSVLPRKTKKALETRPELRQALENFDVDTYQKSLDFASNRCALLISDSLELSVRMIYFLEKDTLLSTQAVIQENFQELEAMKDLFLFNISESYSQLRKLANLV